MKTTVELPDAVFRRAKAAAAVRGQSLKDFFAEAVQRHLLQPEIPGDHAKPWERAFGGLRGLHRENRRIEDFIAAEFETIDEEQWL